MARCPRLRSVSAIVVQGLRKSYGDLEAVKGIDLTVEEGEIFALLGPNGAGKTTTVEILEGFRERTGGSVSVLGFDPTQRAEEMRARIGIVLQSAGIESYLTVAEVVDLYRGYYPHPRDRDEVLTLVGLEDRPKMRVGKLSGGQRRRLDVAVGICGDPDLLFLDEPTTGFDPGARRHAWAVIRGLRDQGKTILLTTHFMDEAQALADRLAIMRAGKIVALGTLDQIQSAHDTATRIRFGLGGDAPTPPTDLVSADARTASGAYEVWSEEPVDLLHRLTGWALDAKVELTELSVARPSLEDTYLELTGEATQATEDAA
jgi:ABC-2 type transport system ATP-binding protein